ncbi:nucleotidyltransferase domain-containing protein [Bacteroidota bacterium]
MNFGLTQKDIELIVTAIQSFKNIEKAIIFGSRAKGNHKRGSDIDIALIGKELSKSDMARLRDLLNEELPLPYFFDVINYHEINNQDLREHIDRVGVTILQSSKKSN